MARQQQEKLTAVTTGAAEHPAFPARCFTAYTRSPWGPAWLPPSIAELVEFSDLSASTGTPGPHDFTVRIAAIRPTAVMRPPHPALDVRDDAWDHSGTGSWRASGDKRKRLSETRCPVLCLHGRSDRLARKGPVNDAVAARPDCQVHWLDGPHMLLATHTDMAARIIEEFCGHLNW